MFTVAASATTACALHHQSGLDTVARNDQSMFATGNINSLIPQQSHITPPSLNTMSNMFNATHALTSPIITPNAPGQIPAAAPVFSSQLSRPSETCSHSLASPANTMYREPRTLQQELKASEGKRKQTVIMHYEGIPNGDDCQQQPGTVSLFSNASKVSITSIATICLSLRDDQDSPITLCADWSCAKYHGKRKEDHHAAKAQGSGHGLQMPLGRFVKLTLGFVGICFFVAVKFHFGMSSCRRGFIMLIVVFFVR
jgi:hypothetical protein